MNSGDPVVSSVWFLLLIVEKNLNKVEDAQNIHPFKVMSNFLFFFCIFQPIFQRNTVFTRLASRKQKPPLKG